MLRSVCSGRTFKRPKRIVRALVARVLGVRDESTNVLYVQYVRSKKFEKKCILRIDF